MNQIWFGLIWINPKESNTQRNQKNKRNKKNQRTHPKKTMFSRLVWTCLDQVLVVPKTLFLLYLFCFGSFFVLFWVVNHSKLYFH